MKRINRKTGSTLCETLRTTAPSAAIARGVRACDLRRRRLRCASEPSSKGYVFSHETIRFVEFRVSQGHGVRLFERLRRNQRRIARPSRPRLTVIVVADRFVFLSNGRAVRFFAAASIR